MSWVQTVVPGSITKSARSVAASCSIQDVPTTKTSTKANAPTVVKGGDSTTIYLASTGNEVSVIMTDISVTTQIVETVSPTTGVIGTTLTISGTLSTTAGVGIASQIVRLQRSVSGSGVWADVTGKIATTLTNGTFSITTSEATPGTYLYRTQFAGATV